MTRSLLFATAVSLTVVLPMTAWADKPRSYRSPQHFAVEFKLGPYAPRIDSEFDGATPFADLFDSGTGVMFRGELDWQIWRGFGSVGVGASLGYYTKSAAPFVDDGGTGQPASGDERVAGETSIALLPISLLAVYRFDPAADRWHIPLVPYVKLGLNYTLWWIRKGDGDVASYEDSDAKGGTLGWQINLGVALRLDVLEPRAAKTLDADVGVNHSYIFFEMLHVDGFSSEALQVGDTTWMAGLSFEF